MVLEGRCSLMRGNGHPVQGGLKLVARAQAEAAFAVCQREKMDLAVQQLQQQLGKAASARTTLEQQLAEVQALPQPSPPPSRRTDSTPDAPATSPPATAADISQLSQPVPGSGSGSSAFGGALQSDAPAGLLDAGRGAAAERDALREENAALRTEVEQLQAAHAAAAEGLRREDFAAALGQPPSQPDSPSTSSSNASDKKQAS